MHTSAILNRRGLSLVYCQQTLLLVYERCGAPWMTTRLTDWSSSASASCVAVKTSRAGLLKSIPTNWPCTSSRCCGTSVALHISKAAARCSPADVKPPARHGHGSRAATRVRIVAGRAAFASAHDPRSLPMNLVKL